MADMYRYVAVLLSSHKTGFSFGKTIEILRQAGSTALSLESISFIADNGTGWSRGRSHEWMHFYSG